MIDHAPSCSAIRRLLALASILVLLAHARPAAATTLLLLDLDALTAAADRVFMGRVLTVRSGRDSKGLPVTWTTFAVDAALKGAPPKTIEIKQLGVDAPLPDGGIFHIPALPSYRVGDEVILFLHPESREGFTSPVGFGQGRFRIRRDGGTPVAENDVGNSNLTAASAGSVPVGSAAMRAETLAAGPPSAAAVLRAPAPIAVDELLTRIRAAADASR
ncbi:MAG: hypothetical protein HY271_19635 [Deltaproteobacteria bacterium]|nr:hypothetical protein [Deltaproteobacteria bacterium]